MRVSVDTSILVRFLVQDDQAQYDAAARLLDRAEVVHIPTVVFCELVWVLRRTYRYSTDEITRALRVVTGGDQAEFDRPSFAAGLDMLARGGDFADGVIALEARKARTDTIATFDQGFARSDPAAVTLLKS